MTGKIHYVYFCNFAFNFILHFTVRMVRETVIGFNVNNFLFSYISIWSFLIFFLRY